MFDALSYAAPGAEWSLCVIRKAMECVHIVANEWRIKAKIQHYLDPLFCCYYSNRDTEKKVFVYMYHVWDAYTMNAPNVQMLSSMVQSVQRSPHQICITFLKLILLIFHGNYDVNNMRNMLLSKQYICFGVWSVMEVTFHNLRLGFFSWIQIFVYWTRISIELKNYTENKHWHENKKRVNAYCSWFLSFQVYLLVIAHLFNIWRWMELIRFRYNLLVGILSIIYTLSVMFFLFPFSSTPTSHTKQI